MRRFLFLLMVNLVCLPVLAQKGLHVAEIFDGDIVAKTYMVENMLKGEQLSRYKLTFFRSIKFKASVEERHKIEALVNEDIRHAIDLEQERKWDGRKDSRAGLNYAVMTLPPQDARDRKSRRYLCYQCLPLRGEYAITLIYMQGHATLDELRKMFKKK